MLADKLWALNTMTRALMSSSGQSAVLWVVYLKVVEVGYEMPFLSIGHC